MNWISTKDKLPEPGKYVLARHSRGTWFDSDDKANVNCIVVKLVKGLSKKDRQLIKEGKLSGRTKADASYYDSADEHGNNLVPYNWEMFGPGYFFGQEITHWMPIEPLIAQV